MVKHCLSTQFQIGIFLCNKSTRVRWQQLWYCQYIIKEFFYTCTEIICFYIYIYIYIIHILVYIYTVHLYIYIYIWLSNTIIGILHICSIPCRQIVNDPTSGSEGNQIFQEIPQVLQGCPCPFRARQRG